MGDYEPIAKKNANSETADMMTPMLHRVLDTLDAGKIREAWRILIEHRAEVPYIFFNIITKIISLARPDSIFITVCRRENVPSVQKPPDETSELMINKLCARVLELHPTRGNGLRHFTSRCCPPVRLTYGGNDPVYTRGAVYCIIGVAYSTLLYDTFEAVRWFDQSIARGFVLARDCKFFFCKISEVPTTTLYDWPLIRVKNEFGTDIHDVLAHDLPEHLDGEFVAAIYGTILIFSTEFRKTHGSRAVELATAIDAVVHSGESRFHVARFHDHGIGLPMDKEAALRIYLESYNLGYHLAAVPICVILSSRDDMFYSDGEGRTRLTPLAATTVGATVPTHRRPGEVVDRIYSWSFGGYNPYNDTFIGSFIRDLALIYREEGQLNLCIDLHTTNASKGDALSMEYLYHYYRDHGKDAEKSDFWFEAFVGTRTNRRDVAHLYWVRGNETKDPKWYAKAATCQAEYSTVGLPDFTDMSQNRTEYTPECLRVFSNIANQSEVRGSHATETDTTFTI